MTVSTSLSVVSTLLALGSLAVARRGLQTAVQLNRESMDARDAAVVTACSQRYLDWHAKGPDFSDQAWCYGMWDLIATEFSFFKQGWLPLFIFRFWMNALGAWYTEHPNAWPSHQRFLAMYSGSLTEMEDFFQGIWMLARDSCGNTAARNRRIEHFVDNWHTGHVLAAASRQARDSGWPGKAGTAQH